MRIFLALLIISLGWITQSCTNEADRHAIRQMEQATPLMQSDPEAAHVLLTDSVTHPELLSPELNARWCLMLCQLADSIGTPLPYVPQMKRAYRYVKRHGTVDEQLQAALYLGRTYMDDLDQEAALRTYTEALQQSILENKPNQSGYISSYMGDVYQFQGMYQQAVEKYLTASRYFRQAENYRSQGIAYIDASRNYTFMDSLDIALRYMLRADSMIVLYGDSMDRASVLNGLGNIHKEKGHYSEAEMYLKKAMDYDTTTIGTNSLALADLYLTQKKFTQTRQVLQDVKSFSDNKYTTFDSLYLLFLLEKEEGHLQLALEALEQYVDITHDHWEARNNVQMQGLEDKYAYTRVLSENMHLREVRSNQFKLLLIALLIILCMALTYRLLIVHKNLKIAQQADELQEQKSHLLEQQMALDTLSCQLKAVQQDNQEELRQKQSEYDQKAQEVEILKQQYIQQRQYLLRESTIYKKIQKLVSTPNPDHKELLTDKDWKAIYKCIDTMYPSLSERLVLAGITPTEKKYCYLSFFQLDSKQEAFLLNVNIDTPYKNRTRIRQKLKITGSEEKLYEHLALWV
ncbi:MAG: hypothetical protein MSK40_04155 [Parabacteroides sp.]|nr:hypothetical protein [Parabacteroides sp.]